LKTETSRKMNHRYERFEKDINPSSKNKSLSQMLYCINNDLSPDIFPDFLQRKEKEKQKREELTREVERKEKERKENENKEKESINYYQEYEDSIYYDSFEEDINEEDLLDSENEGNDRVEAALILENSHRFNNRKKINKDLERIYNIDQTRKFMLEYNNFKRNHIEKETLEILLREEEEYEEIDESLWNTNRKRDEVEKQKLEAIEKKKITEEKIQITFFKKAIYKVVDSLYYQNIMCSFLIDIMNYRILEYRIKNLIKIKENKNYLKNVELYKAYDERNLETFEILGESFVQTIKNKKK